MKIRKYLTIGCLGMVCLTACGTATKNAETTTADVATASDVSVTVEVPDRPAFKDMGTISLADHDTIPVTLYYEKEDITDDYVNEYMENVAANYTSEVDRAAKDSDTVNIDYTGKIDGEEFEGGSATSYNLVLGQGYFLDDLEDGIVGMKKGETKDIIVKFPDDYYDDTVAGKEAVFTVTMNSVSEPAEITDNFVVLHSTEGSKTIEEYREELRQKLQDWNDVSYNDSIYYGALNYFEENSTIELSDAMLDYEKKSEEKSFRDSFDTDDSITLAEYCEQLGMTEDELMEQVTSSAESNAKREFILEALTEEGNYEVTDETKSAYIDYCSKEYGMKMDEDQVKSLYGLDSDEAFNEAIVNYLVKMDLVSKSQVTVEDYSSLYTTDDTEIAEDTEATDDTADTETEAETPAETN